MKRILALLRKETAVASIEYALAGALIACVIVAGVAPVGTSVGALYEHVACRVQTAASGHTGQGC